MVATHKIPADWTTLECGAWRWTALPAWAETLLGEGGLRWDAWEAAGLVTIIKSAAHRTVWRVELPDGAVYIKHYPLNDLRAQMRQQLRPSKARTEAGVALELHRRGVPTITPLAFAETAAGESYLITRALDQTWTLKEFIESGAASDQPFPIRKQLTLALADLLARLHDAGVLHEDLHAGNLLVDARSQQLHLIDLHAVRLGGPLDWEASRANLVMLNRWFVQRSSRAERCRFWRRYVEQRTMPLTSVAVRPACAARDLAIDLERRTWESCLAFWRKRDARCQGTNRYFYQLAANGQKGWAVRDLPPVVLLELLREPDRPFERPIKLLKDSRSSTVAEIELVIDGRPRRLIWKRFAVTKWSDPWVQMLRPTPAFKSWLNGHRLLESGLPTARPLAVVQRQALGLPREGYLLTEKVEGAVDLQVAASVGWALPTTRFEEGGQCPTLQLERVARLIRELHRRNLTHRDLKAANILVDGAGKLFLIDLVGLERLRDLPRARRVQNLARLHVSFHNHPHLSRTDKLRFLRTYLFWGLRGKAGWKDWWRAIGEATERKIRKNSRSGRPLS